MPDLDSTIKGAGAILVVLLGVLFYRLHHSTTFVADGIDPSWDAAARYSEWAGQPTVVLFTADWCPTCRLLHRDVLSRESGVEFKSLISLDLLGFSEILGKGKGSE